MRSGEGVCAHPAVLPEHAGIPIFDDRRQFHVTQLAYIEVASVFSPGPPQEDVASSLHETLHKGCRVTNRNG